METAQPIQVVKCGGSVLATDAAAVADAVAAMTPPLIVVVSAPAGETDARFASIPLEASTSGSQIAEFVSRGEREMSVRMAAMLQDRSMAARPIGVQDLGLIASGDALDADPESLDADATRALLSAHPVLVVPGFVALGRGGDWKLLGRGGSDATAVFLTAELRGSCRLMQSTAGVFDRNPAMGPATRFARMHWDDVLDLDEAVIQPKAVRLAKQRRIPLTVTGLRPAPATIVADCPAVPAGPEHTHADS